MTQHDPRIERLSDPPNLESPAERLVENFRTPADLFYVRNHFPIPAIPQPYRIRVEGCVARPFEIGLEELRTLPSRGNCTATLECAGNSRTFLVPRQSGVAWHLGAVSTATWTGVPLAALLDRAGPEADAVEVLLEGADQGELTGEPSPKPPGRISFARSIPLEKARCEEVILAFQMNGRDLLPEHGFPVRAVVPGYYGMASVKWLSTVRVLNEPFRGYWQTTEYAYWDRSSTGLPVRRPLFEMRVKSMIARPALHESIPAGSVCRIVGAAWAGESEIARVEVSTDGGETWSDARLVDPVSRFAWSRWDFSWQVPSRKGRCTLLSRATDITGRRQPDARDDDYQNYAIHHILPIEVNVE
jgi:DMSO/TMAO reductase YedYZ molybdopterin-dependent catalytic subunit